MFSHLLEWPSCDAIGALCSLHEFQNLSLDAAIKCCMGVMGQESHRAAKGKRNMAPFDDFRASRWVLTVRGRTGAVVALVAVSSQRAEEMVLALAAHLPARGLSQVQCLASDSASKKLNAELKQIMPNLQLSARPDTSLHCV